MTTNAVLPKSNEVYKMMEDANIPEDIIHTISKRVHMDYHRRICTYIDNIYSPFERIFRENEINGVHALTKLCEQFPEMIIRVDDYFEWMTVVLKLNDTRFIVFHEYKENWTCEQLIAEGEYINDNMIFERFLYKDMRDKNKLYKNAKDYFNNKSINYIPFQFTNYVMKGIYDMDGVQFMDAPTNANWFRPEVIIQWFLDREDDVWRPIAQEEEMVAEAAEAEDAAEEDDHNDF